MGNITFATMMVGRMRLLHMRHVEAVFWCRVIQQQWWEGTAVCVAARLSRQHLRNCKKSSGVTAGKSWIPGAACGDGKSIVISGKMNHSDLASFRVVRARQPLSTHTLMRES